jgi:hypothetical protein
MSTQETAIFTVGGKDHTIPPAKFGVLKKIWPGISQAANMGLRQQQMSVDDPGYLALHAERMDLMVGILIAAGKLSNPELTAQYVDENMSLDETRLVPVAFSSLMAISGFEQGEVKPLVPAPVEESTATPASSTESSQN